MRNRMVCALPVLLLFACGDTEDGSTSAKTPDKSESPAVTPEPENSAEQEDDEGGGHGERLDLGTLTLGDFAFEVARLGELVAGEEGAFAVTVAEHPEGADPNGLNMYLWVEDQERAQVSAPAKGDLEEGSWHFHATPRAGSTPTRVVLRLRHDGSDQRGGLPLSGHGHEHAESVHGGMPAVFKDASGTVAGHLELKLHDDKGDLELWLARDEMMKEPFDLALDATVEVTFIDVENRVAVLRVRNAASNEDEDGNPNVREGKTNYFIFPGDSGADAKWLMGKEFSSIVNVAFTEGTNRYESEEFVLAPHTHAEGEPGH